MLKLFIQLLIFIISISFFYSCQTTKKVDLSSADYWMEKNMLERFVGMQEGLFVMYDSSATRPRIMKSGDSLLLYSVQFANPAKDGIWLYQKMYMSTLPDAPLSLNFLKVKQTSADQIVVEQFDVPEMDPYIQADKKAALLNNVDFKTLKPVSCDITFTKTKQTKFEGDTPVCEIKFDGGHTQIYKNKFVIEPQGVRLNTLYYKKEEGEYIYKSKGDAYLIRTKGK